MSDKMEKPNKTTDPSVEQDSGQSRPETNPSLGLTIVLALALLVGMGYLWQTYGDAETIPPTIKALGQFHPSVVHLPIGILVVVYLMEILGLFKSLRYLKQSTHFLLWMAAIFASVGMVLGYMLKISDGQTGDLLEKHMWAGVAVVAGSLAALMLRSTGGGFLYGLVLTATVLSVGVAGHLGGSMTHGSSYLTKHMPDDWKLKEWLDVGNWFGGDEGEESVDEEEEQGSEGSETVYEAVIVPILESKCTACHNEEKTKGKLRMDEYDLMMASEGVLVPGDVDASELHVRIQLPLDDEDHMPPEDEEPLTEDEIAILSWWIANDGTAGLKMADADIPEDIAAAIASLPKTGAKGEGAKGADVPAEKDAGAGDAQAEAVTAEVKKLEEKGYAVRRISQEDDTLEFNAVNVADSFDDAALSLFAPLASKVGELNLARTEITDAGAATLGKMTGLTKLHIEGTAITDAGLAQLTSLENLEWLNLYDTAITDEGLKQLESLPKLKKVFVWQTEVTDKGVKALESAIPGIEVERGWESGTAAPEAVAKPGPAKTEAVVEKKGEAAKPAPKAGGGGNAKKPKAAKPAATPKPGAEAGNEKASKGGGPAKKGRAGKAKPGAEEKPATKEAPEAKETAAKKKAA